MEKDYTPTEKGAWLGWAFAQGRTFTVAQVAEELGITHRGADLVLKSVSRVIPITPVDRVWQPVIVDIVEIERIVNSNGA
jgi:hypothetical protein